MPQRTVRSGCGSTVWSAVTTRASAAPDSLSVVRSSAVYQLLRELVVEELVAECDVGIGRRLPGRRSAARRTLHPAGAGVGRAGEPGGSVPGHLRVVGGPVLVTHPVQPASGRRGCAPEAAQRGIRGGESLGDGFQVRGDEDDAAVHHRALVRVGVLALPVVLAGGAPVGGGVGEHLAPGHDAVGHLPDSRGRRGARCGRLLGHGARSPRRTGCSRTPSRSRGHPPRPHLPRPGPPSSRTAVSTRWRGRAVVDTTSILPGSATPPPEYEHSGARRHPPGQAPSNGAGPLPFSTK